MSYLKSFIVGSSYPVFVLFFINVQRIEKNYKYEQYTLIAPLYFGLINMLSLYIQNMFTLDFRQRYIYISILSSIIVSNIAYFSNAYNYTVLQWIWYFFRIFVLHFITFNFIIFNLQKNIS